MSNLEILFRRRAIAIKEAKLRARDPEWKTLWEQKLNELIRNEETRLQTLPPWKL